MKQARQVGSSVFLWPVLALSLLFSAAFTSSAQAIQFAYYIMDARTGQTLFSKYADVRINPASLTKMMTLYITFQELKAGRVTMNTMVTVSKEAAGMPPSHLGLKAGQKIQLRYLIRAAAVKSANDAAAAIGDFFAGSPAAWGARMTATARELGMMHTTFRNANGLTEKGHLSTARDLTILGRHLFYDFPQYYYLFSRRSANAGIATVHTTNDAFLNGYRGADGIKTGYTNAAGFNLCASAERGGVHIIGTVIGMPTVPARTKFIEKLFNEAFRKAPRHVVAHPTRMAALVNGWGQPLLAPVSMSPRPPQRPVMVAAAKPGTLQPAAAQPAATEVASAATATATTAATTVSSTAAEMQAAIASAIAAVSAAPPPATTIAATVTASAPPVAASASTPPVTTAGAPPHTLQYQAEQLAAEHRPQPASAENAVLLSGMSEAPPKRQVSVYYNTASFSGNGSPDQPPPAAPEFIRISTSGGGNWGVLIGTYNTSPEAIRALLRVQLSEAGALGESLGKVVRYHEGYRAKFFGLSQESAALVCSRLDARGQNCSTFGPS